MQQSGASLQWKKRELEVQLYLSDNVSADAEQIERVLKQIEITDNIHFKHHSLTMLVGYFGFRDAIPRKAENIGNYIQNATSGTFSEDMNNLGTVHSAAMGQS